MLFVFNFTFSLGLPFFGVTCSGITQCALQCVQNVYGVTQCLVCPCFAAVPPPVPEDFPDMENVPSEPRAGYFLVGVLRGEGTVKN